MTNKEAIEIIKVAIAEVEWNYPADYAVAFEKAIEALEGVIIPELSYKQHVHHKEIIKKFCALNKYVLSEQMINALDDAAECMDYIIDKTQ